MGMDITCIRVKPYRLGSEVVLDVQQIIPLPEAKDYEVKVREQEQENRKARSANEVEWSGNWYSNVSEGPARSWKDMCDFGFIAAGGGLRWSEPLKKLKLGDKVYAYQSGSGYVGYGVVSTEAMPVQQFQVEVIKERPLQQPGLLHDLDNPDITEWVVGVVWNKTVGLEEAKKMSGMFANQASVCRLMHLETLKFLRESFHA